MMNVSFKESSSGRTKVLRLFFLLQVLVFGPMIGASFFGCARTVETQTVHDTDTVIQHDTDTVRREGPAWVRFINFLTQGGVIVLKTDLSSSITPFGDATQVMGKEYIPIRSDTSIVLYTTYYISGQPYIDSITIPADSLHASSLNTIVLFQVEQDGGIVRISPYFANDSLRLLTPAPGTAYFRLINGIADYPQPSPTVNAYLDNANGSPLFKDKSGAPESVSFLELKNYIPIPAGQHTIYIRRDDDPLVLYSGQKNFRSGGYYTGRLNGSKNGGNDAFSIDEE